MTSTAQTWDTASAGIRSRRSLPTATLFDTLAVFIDIFMPNVAKGLIVRRPRMVALAERLGLDDRSVRRMQHLRNKYGTGPLLLWLPPRSQVVILSPEHVHRVLEGSPDPYATASSEKRAALSHFEPKGALISHGAERTARRQFNEAVLESDRPVHRLGDSFMHVVEEEATGLLHDVSNAHGELTWDRFATTWFRVVRRVVFGDAARDDVELRETIDRLRSHGNWAFLSRRREDLRKRLFARMQHYVDRAEPGSLANAIAQTPAVPDAAPLHQIPQWLFAFDPAGMTTFRSLALLALHDDAAARARREAAERQGAARQELPYMRATVLESLRLWPTTPLVLRQSTRETTWEAGDMPANTGVLIYAPFFHRDDQRLPYAHHFTPELWLHERRPESWPLIPFSGGPAICPGRHLVLLVTSAMLAALIEQRQVRLESPKRLDPSRLPGTLDNYSLRFEFDR